jgi:hypothetical protein
VTSTREMKRVLPEIAQNWNRNSKRHTVKQETFSTITRLRLSQNNWYAKRGKGVSFTYIFCILYCKNMRLLEEDGFKYTVGPCTRNVRRRKKP